MNSRNNQAGELELAGVLYVGKMRAQALADAGIRTLDDLRAADAARIGSVKGVGLRNGERIKRWLAERDGAPALDGAGRAGQHEPPGPDFVVGGANQAIQDDMTSVDGAITRIQQAIPSGVSHKKLDRQVDKLLAVLSELAEGPDTLRPKQMRRALKMLHLIATLLEKFSGIGLLSDKIVAAFADELRDRRRRLEDILDPKK